MCLIKYGYVYAIKYNSIIKLHYHGNKDDGSNIYT